MKLNHLYAWLGIIGFSQILGCGSKIDVSHHKVGEKISVEKLSLTVDRISRNISGENNAQTETLGVHLTVVNKAKYPVSFKIEEFTLRDAQGKTYEGYPQGGPGSLLSTGRYLAMDDRINGILLFNVPKDAAGLVLCYAPEKIKKVFFISTS
jgi:hypothetical protein